MKNMAYVSEHISKNSVIENEMWPDRSWKPYFYAVVSHRGNVCSLKETKFRNLPSWKIPTPTKWPEYTEHDPL